MLFLDARQVFRQVDRAHRDFTEQQTEFLARASMPTSKGLCEVATIKEIEAQGWSLNPDRYVGTEVEEIDEGVFEEQLAESHAELRALGAGARDLEDAVDGVLEQPSHRIDLNALVRADE